MRQRMADDDTVHQPLLGDEHNHNASGSTPCDVRMGERRQQQQQQPQSVFSLLTAIHHSFVFCTSTLVSCVAWIRSVLSVRPDTRQLKELVELRTRIQEPFDHEEPEHEQALSALWSIAFPNEEWPAAPSRRWTDLGFQGSDPATDFRGGGIFSLLNLLYMAQHHSEAFNILWKKSNGNRVEMEYPFAAAGINITYKLQELLELRVPARTLSAVPRTVPGQVFLMLSTNHSHAFEELYVVTFELLDKIWLETKATYMEFPTVMQTTVAAVQTALMQKPTSIDSIREMVLPTP